MPESPSSISTTELVAQYSQGFNDAVLTSHGVSSALGLWVLLALIAPDAQGDDRKALEVALGTTAEDAARRATELLESPHPALASAMALWFNPDYLNERFSQFSVDVPEVLTQGPVPDQAAADAWASEHTYGLIKKFPVVVQPLTAVVLASALATKANWVVPFYAEDIKSLGGEFADQTAAALRAPEAHWISIIRTEAAGLVGVHSAYTTEGLLVLSVIGGGDIGATQMHRAALEVGTIATSEDLTMQCVSLFDLELGEGLAWDIAQHEYEGEGLAQQESYAALAAAWEMETRHDLGSCPGVAAIFSTMDEWLRPELRPGAFEAKQVAMARFTKEGFEAAAVTAVTMVGAAMPQLRHVTERTATVRFNRPYAVLALTVATMPDPAAPWRDREVGSKAWHGVPVFAAWVGRVGPE